MPLLPCRECKREVSDEARACPHCGLDLPARRFDAGGDWVYCPHCCVRNEYHPEVVTGVCRACKGPLDEALRKRTRAYYAKLQIILFLLGGLAVGCCVGGVVGGGRGGAVFLLVTVAATWVGVVRYQILRGAS